MIRRAIIGLLLAQAALCMPAIAQPGVAPLLQQGRYWQGKGRADLARTAYRRVLALDPGNEEARRALRGPTTPTPAPAPVQNVVVPQVRPQPATAPVAVSEPGPRRAAPAPVDRGGDARAAGFRALDAGQLGQAERLFERALAANGNDGDASGGLGIVRLRQSRFADAARLLGRASSRGNAARWSEALDSARFFAGLAEARGKLERGDVTGAQADAEQLARLPVRDRGPALALLADIYERQGRYADAADLARQAGAAGGSETQLQVRVARDQALQAAQRGDTQQAEAQFQRGLQVDQSDPWIRYEFARYLLARGRVPEADSLIQSLQTIGSGDANYAAAMLHAQLGRQTQANALLARIPEGQRTAAIRRFAGQLTVDAAIARARTIAGQGRNGEAVAALRGIGETPGLSAASLSGVAGALDELGDSAGAMPLAQRALAATPASPAEYEPIVRIFARGGADASVADAIARARSAATGSAGGEAEVARLQAIAAAGQADRLRLAGQYAPAFDLLQQAWTAAPNEPEVLGALARLYQSGNMASQAAQTYQLVLARNPRDKGALTGLIGAAGAAGDHDLAVATVERALQTYPDDPQIYAAAGQMEQARGDSGAARRYLRRGEAAYAARGGAGQAVSGGNPFAGGPASSNPFRAMEAAAAPAVATNPFALSGGRIPAAPRGVMATPAATVPAAAIGDPELARLRAQIASQVGDSGPRAEMTLGYRERSGETGLSGLRELSGTARVSTSVGGGRIALSATPVVIDSGRPTGSALARFGRNATAEAEAIVAEEPSRLAQAETQHASGVAVQASYDSPAIRIEIGTTPLGFDDTKVTWGFTARPRLSNTVSAQGWVRSEAVGDSIVSYAGTRDPVTGARWGQVMRTGGGASLSWDREGTGIYGDISGFRYAGDNVRGNRGYQANVGGYLPLYRDGSSTFTGGVNINWQAFDNNQNFFTFGHGGYFSPQSFLSMSLPLRYTYSDNRWEARLGGAPGYQSFEQDRAPIYPTDPTAQAALDALKASNSDVRSYYDSLSVTGFAFAADGSLYYRITPNTRVGATASVNTFGTYDEYRSTFELRQSLGRDR
ncbi:cellulose biosynthesis protein BcsC [Sphingomonas sp. Leaf4]|uniref:cellulose biosynthesis protein BcsC n=1 Tax=Sphingomonas sp. Leaf4 TaxID=2876553 RepID=UPI001E6206D4|nr:cellulose biosynthesis protein BcsC [Sphingomonas sp. Leaf4]